MRKVVLMMLLASSVAMPAMAQDDGSSRRDRASQDERDEARAARAEQRADQPQRAQQPRADQPQRAQQPRRAERPQRADRASWSEQSQPSVMQQNDGRPVVVRENGERREWGRRRGSTPVVQQQVMQQQVIQQQVTQQRDGYRRSRDGSLNDQIRDRLGSQPGVTVVPRDQARDRDRDRNRDRYSGSGRNWSGQWRTDRNYDWRHYRDRNRSIFRQGRYWDPYGSNYRRFSIGFSLYPSYYQSNYWLDDPWMYRLPQAYGPYRWVRYYDDALLVNIYSGQVVDVVYSFFW